MCGVHRASRDRWPQANTMPQVLAEWFDLLWADPGSTTIVGDDDVGLTKAQRQILHLMAAGRTDESIASHTGKSVRTVRRHIGAIMSTLRVDRRSSPATSSGRRTR